MNRLFRQDRLIAFDTIRATFAGWHDRVIATLMVLAALAVAHAWFADRPWRIAAWTALGAGTLIGIGAGRLFGGRLAFHVFDGLLAADALHPQARRRYMAAWHGIGLVLLAVATLIVRSSLLIISVPAYLAGVLIAGLTDGVRIPKRIVGTARPGWTLRAWSHRPVAGVAAATVLLLLLLPSRTLGTNALMAVVGIASMLLTLTLTSIDDVIVRFMTVAGHGSRRIVVHHGKGDRDLPCRVSTGMLDHTGAGSACVAMLLLLTLRALAYRLHAKRFADFLVSILAGLLMLVAYSMPVAFPVLAILWQL